ncbi:MAG: (2Fe-2S)-binding protein [Campylobacterota bacterium]|nr:(2Fe-2S)-binding protein [Campylobacterota bacterium]
MNRELCVCNSLSLQDVVTLIKENNITSLEMLQDSKYSIADKCESCLEEGYENDGFSLAMALSLVKQGRL